MRRPIAEHAEVVRAADEALTEMPAPDAVHHHARGERMLRAREPACEFEAATLLRRHFRAQVGHLHYLREAARRGLAEREMAAANVDGQRLDDVGRVHHAHRAGQLGRVLLQRRERLAELLQLGDGVRWILGLGSLRHFLQSLVGDERFVGRRHELRDG